jgi:hypothetical protein
VNDVTARQKRFDELELSIQCAAWIRTLGIRTVGELLDLPRLVLPDELIEAELAAHLDELGVTYEGEIVDRAQG